MKTLFAKLEVYLGMDTDIPFGEFTEYYNNVITILQADFKDMDKETLLDAISILTVVAGNAIDRAKAKNVQAKKYKKIAEKSQFWNEAIARKLGVEHGLSREAINALIDSRLPEGDYEN